MNRWAARTTCTSFDGAGLEAMVELHRNGVYIEWAHGHGDCAITGAGHALLAVLRGERSAEDCEAAGDLTLYGDRDLIDRAPDVFTPRPGEFPGSDTYAVRRNPISGPLITAWAEAGGRPSEIATAYRVEKRTVSRWQRRLGFRWSRPVNPSRESLPELWDRMLTLQEMGAELGVTARTVSRWAREFELPPRRRV